MIFTSLHGTDQADTGSPMMMALVLPAAFTTSQIGTVVWHHCLIAAASPFFFNFFDPQIASVLKAGARWGPILQAPIARSDVTSIVH